MMRFQHPILFTFILTLFSSYAMADVVDDAPEAADYTLVYELQIPDTAAYNYTGVNYTVDASDAIDFTFDRVAYHLELQEPGGDRVFVYVSLPALALTPEQIGVPHSGTATAFQQLVEDIHVVSNHPGLAGLSTLDTGSIEFWPSNYGTANALGVPNSNNNLYDAGDESSGGAGYGSMQIHDYASGQTLFAYNAWGAGGYPSDLGIGNNPAPAGEYVNPDWTFSQNAESYTLKTLRVLVHPGEAPQGLSMTIQSPQPHQVVQRRPDNTATLQVGGQLRLPCDLLEARLIPIDINNQDAGPATNWQTIDDEPSGSSFSGSIHADAGWYRMELRVWKNEVVLDTVHTYPIGIGEVFITAGQSNSANHGELPTTPSDPRVSAWGPGGWQFGADPQPIATGDGGSPWPALGDLLAQRWNLPIGLISIGWGGTYVDQWRPYGASALYARLLLALDTVGPDGARAILWHQGESDASANTTAAAYANQLREVIAASRADGGWDIPWGIAQAAFLPGLEATALGAITDGQQAVIDADPLVFSGANTEDLLGPEWRYDEVHFNLAGLQEHAQRWSDAIELPTAEESPEEETPEETQDENQEETTDTNPATPEPTTEDECVSEDTDSGGCQSTQTGSMSLILLLLLLLPMTMRTRYIKPSHA